MAHGASNKLYFEVFPLKTFKRIKLLGNVLLFNNCLIEIVPNGFRIDQINLSS